MSATQRRNLRRWIAALRSGKFKQTVGVLRRNDAAGNAVGHCCLGVLCEISGGEAAVERDKPYFRMPNGVEYNPRSLPLGVARQQFGDDLAGRNSNDMLRPLAVMNDDGATFADIANILEDALIADQVGISFAEVAS